MARWIVGRLGRVLVLVWNLRGQAGTRLAALQMPGADGNATNQNERPRLRVCALFPIPFCFPSGCFGETMRNNEIPGNKE